MIEADGLEFTESATLDKDVEGDEVVHSRAFVVAAAIAEVAAGTAPVQTGAYKAGIGAEETKRGARVIAKDPKSAWIEFGEPGINVPAKFNLRNAAVALGYDFIKTGHGNA